MKAATFSRFSVPFKMEDDPAQLMSALQIQDSHVDQHNEAAEPEVQHDGVGSAGLSETGYTSPTLEYDPNVLEASTDNDNGNSPIFEDSIEL